ncbi:hypothetical protein [Paenibacillus wulumuqiensis]|uniref:hypothetical protein n=1 Tax=Paenibacillus wulumuqiensis TaxID=1567107 RepID=UPI000619D2D4|nr:hypothetical protein [Paenibacillus wulumuqiensis]
MMLFKKLLLPASVILVLAGCGNTQDTLHADHTGISSSSSTWSTDQAGDDANVETDDYAENDDDTRATNDINNPGSPNSTDNTSNPPTRENSSGTGNVSTTVKTTTSVETSVSAGSSTSVETSTSVEMNHSSNPSPTTASSLSPQEKKDIQQYLQTYMQAGTYIGQQLQKPNELFENNQELTSKEMLGIFQEHADNVSTCMQNLKAIPFPSISDSKVRKDVVQLRDHVWNLLVVQNDMMQETISYLQTDDESYADQILANYQKLQPQSLTVMQEAEQLAPLLQ